jgi:hypothetical protein
MLLLPIAFDILTYFFPEMNSYKEVGGFIFHSRLSCIILQSGYSNNLNSKIPFKMSFFDKIILLLDSTNSIETETIIDIQHETFEETIHEIVLWKSKMKL